MAQSWIDYKRSAVCGRWQYGHSELEKMEFILELLAMEGEYEHYREGLGCVTTRIAQGIGYAPSGWVTDMLEFMVGSELLTVTYAKNWQGVERAYYRIRDGYQWHGKTIDSER